MHKTRLGLLGGGQLGAMLLPECMKWGIVTAVLDPDPHCSCAAWSSHFTQGDFRDYDTVFRFGQHVDLLTIEIEQVNTHALRDLEAMGKRVFPQPDKLSIIQDKGLQKQFYVQQNLPTADFVLFDNAADIREALAARTINYPFVQKKRTMGYDGKGVQMVHSAVDLPLLFDVPSVVEKLVPIQKELSVIVAQDAQGNARAFPPVEMVFHATANLVEILQCPADISPEIAAQAEQIAIETLRAFDVRGVLAVELLLDTHNCLYINEVAPRPHTSGHHTIESSISSQYEQHLRSILGLPLGSTALKMPAVMLNILGELGHKGVPIYSGLAECLALDGVNIHLYGKQQTYPYRKMGHVTIIDPDLPTALQKAKIVQNKLKVLAEVG